MTEPQVTGYIYGEVGDYIAGDKRLYSATRFVRSGIVHQLFGLVWSKGGIVKILRNHFTNWYDPSVVWRVSTEHVGGGLKGKAPRIFQRHWTTKANLMRVTNVAQQPHYVAVDSAFQGASANNNYTHTLHTIRYRTFAILVGRWVSVMVGSGKLDRSWAAFGICICGVTYCTVAGALRGK